MDINKLCIGCMKELKQPGICPHCGYDPQKEAQEGHYLKPYTILNGKYLVGKVLGEGGFGITYIGYDLNLEMPVAIKEFYPNGFVTRESSVTSCVSVYTGTNLDAVQKWKNNFIKEARTLAKCSHLSGIVGVKDFFEENKTAYIAMEYLEGMTLKAYVKASGGKIEVYKLLKYLEPVMTSLAKVHESGLIHRDISPDNIMLLENGNMKLLDFGAARDYASEEEKSLSVMLKPGYAPEEQYRTKGKQGPWSDVYAFAATIYKCITGITPPESMERIRNDELKKPSELGIVIDSRTEYALLKGMEVFAENRYQSMTEFMADICQTNPKIDAPAKTEQAAPYLAQPAQPFVQPVQTFAQPSKPFTQETGSYADTTPGQAKAVKTGKEDWMVPVQKNWKVIVAVAAVFVIVMAVFISRSSKEDGSQMTAADVEANTDNIAQTNTETEETVKEAAEESVVVTQQLGEEEIEQLAEESIQNAENKMKTGDYDTALSYLEKARALDAEREEIYSLECDIYLQLNDIDNAIAILDEGIAQTNKIALNTKKNNILENTRMVAAEKYQDDVLCQSERYDEAGNTIYQEVYDISGNLSEWGEYFCDGDWLYEEIHYNADGTLARDIVYDADGNILQIKSVNRQGEGEIGYYYYSYGMLSRIDYYAVYNNNESNTLKWYKMFDYDNAGNQIRDYSYNNDGSLSSWQEYTYDANGKMTGFSAFYGDGTLNASGRSVYDADENKIESYECDTSGKQVWKEEYTYDVMGNCIAGKHYNGGNKEVSYEWSYVYTYEFED